MVIENEPFNPDGTDWTEQEPIETTEEEQPEEQNGEEPDAGEGQEGEEAEETAAPEDAAPDDPDILVVDVDGEELQIPEDKLPEVLRNVKAAYIQNQELRETVKTLKQHEAVSRVIVQNPFLNTVFSYTAQGANPRQIIEALVNQMDASGEWDKLDPANIPQQPQIDPTVAALQQELSQLKQAQSQQIAQQRVNENLGVMTDTFFELGYEADAGSEEAAAKLAQTELVRLLKNVGHDPDEYLSSRQVPKELVELAWAKAAKSSNGVIRKQGESPAPAKKQDPVRAAVRRIKSSQRAQGTQVPRVSGKAGNPTNGRTSASGGKQKVGNFTYADNASHYAKVLG